MDITEIAEKFENFRKIAEFGEDITKRVTGALSKGVVPDVELQNWITKKPQRGMLVLTGALACYAGLKLVVLVHHLAFEWPLPHQGGSNEIESRTSDPWDVVFRALFHGSSLYFIEASLLICIVWYVNSKGNKDTELGDKGTQRAATAENQFFQYWWPLWGTWFLLYVFLGLCNFKGWNDEIHHLVAYPYYCIGSDFLNNLSGVCFYGMYHVLSEDTVSEHAKQSKKLWFPILLVLIFLAVAEYVLGSMLPGADVVYHCGSLMSGLFVGTMTALFVSKLASRTLDLPRWEIGLLAMYAVLQAVFPALSWRDNFGEYVGYAVVILALYSKVVLLMVIEWARDNYRIQYYMLRARQIYLEERKVKQHNIFACLARELYCPSTDAESTPAPGPVGDGKSPAVPVDTTNVVTLQPRDQKGT